MRIPPKLPLVCLLFALGGVVGCPGEGSSGFATGDDDDDTANDDDDANANYDDDDDDDTTNDDDDTNAPCPSGEPVSGTDVMLVQIGGGLDRPVDITSARDGTDRIFVAEQDGVIRVFQAGIATSTVWLDIQDRVFDVAGLGDERGLLALAFHPEFPTNGLVYVHYSDISGDTVISEFTVGSPTTGTPEPGSERVVLTVEQPANNHNGGSIHFGPDGFLYIGLGDGGGAGDIFGNGQRASTLLAKILRLDVTDPPWGETYVVPADNPFLGEAVVNEAWAWGLRNPWRWSFDRETGQMWIADVGQNEREEISVGAPGANFGWPCREASADYDGCNGDFTDPVFEYGHNVGISVTGGYVYRGCRLPDLQGQYFFSDFGYAPDSPLWSIDTAGSVGDVWEASTGLLIATFGEDEAGELLVGDYIGGTIHRMVPQ